MRRACNRVFWYAYRMSEVAGYEIIGGMFFCRTGDDEAMLPEKGRVGCKCSNRSSGGQLYDISVHAVYDIEIPAGEELFQFLRDGAVFIVASGEVQLDPAILLRGCQYAAERIELKGLAMWLSARLPEDMCGGKGRVTTERHFFFGREPAQAVSFRAWRRTDHRAGNKKGCLGQIVLYGDGLHERVGDGCIEQTDRGRIAFEGLMSKGVYLIKGDIHRAGFLVRTIGP